MSFLLKKADGGENIVMWKRMGEKPIYEGYRTLVQREYELPSGKVHSYDIVKGRPVVCALVLDSEGRVVLTRQFRPGPEREVFVLPGGVIDPGETPAQAMERECLEETGYEGRSEFLVSTWAGAYSTTIRHHFIIQNAKPIPQPAIDPDEIAGVAIMTWDEVWKAVWDGKMMDVETLFLAASRLSPSVIVPPCVVHEVVT